MRNPMVGLFLRSQEQSPGVAAKLAESNARACV
jgi:hypothetical protein